MALTKTTSTKNWDWKGLRRACLVLSSYLKRPFIAQCMRFVIAHSSSVAYLVHCHAEKTSAAQPKIPRITVAARGSLWISPTSCLGLFMVSGQPRVVWQPGLHELRFKRRRRRLSVRMVSDWLQGDLKSVPLLPVHFMAVKFRNSLSYLLSFTIEDFYQKTHFWPEWFIEEAFNALAICLRSEEWPGHNWNALRIAAEKGQLRS